LQAFFTRRRARQTGFHFTFCFLSSRFAWYTNHRFHLDGPFVFGVYKEENLVEKLTYENGVYRSPARTLSLLPRVLPSFSFYTDVFMIVWRGSSQAKHGRYKTADWCQSSFDTLRALERVGVSLEITGTDAFSSYDGPCVFIGNHMSVLETFVLPTIISSFKDSTFVVKQSLVDYPIFKYMMRSRDPITVGRSNARDDLKAVLEGGTERLKAGRSIVIFPQKTRTASFDPSQFNTIGIKLAKKACVPVVPIALKTDAWGTGRWIKDYGKIDPARKVHIAFGKPMSIKDRGNEEHAAIAEFIVRKLKEWEEGSR
jgi:1-acyl-sn-glycerol-3-phosphate acyltransferase